MVKATKRKKKIFDEEADWVPQKGRLFKMKARTKGQDPEEDPKTTNTPVPAPPQKPRVAPPKLYSDSEGLDMAYADSSNLFLDSQGTLFVSGTKGGFLGQEWL